MKQPSVSTLGRSKSSQINPFAKRPQNAHVQLRAIAPVLQRPSLPSVCSKRITFPGPNQLPAVVQGTRYNYIHLLDRQESSIGSGTAPAVKPKDNNDTPRKQSRCVVIDRSNNGAGPAGRQPNSSGLYSDARDAQRTPLLEARQVFRNLPTHVFLEALPLARDVEHDHEPVELGAAQITVDTRPIERQEVLDGRDLERERDLLEVPRADLGEHDGDPREEPGREERL